MRQFFTRMQRQGIMTGEALRAAIRYEDQDLIVFHKKPGIAVETKQTGQQDAVSLLKNHRAEKGEDPYIAPVNRLDQPVEGLVLFAKNEKAAADLSAQLARGEMEKRYLAVVWDHHLPEEGELKDFLRKETAANLSRIVPEGTKGAKEALLSFRKIRGDGTYALVEIHLLTGRHHQIRAQMSFHGWPLLGDRKYGDGFGQKDFSSPALCAYRLGFTHPVSGARQVIEIRPEGTGFLVFAGFT